MMQILERLRRAREEQGLDIEALSQRTRVRVHLLEAVEQGRFDDLPRGVYARAVIRAYASAVGVEPNRAVTEVASLLPEPEDPLDGLARVRGFERTREAGTSSAGSAPAAGPAAGARRVSRLAQDAAAAAIDGLLLMAINLVGAAGTALAVGVPMTDLYAAATPAMLMLGGLIAGTYFLLLGGIAGATPGQRGARSFLQAFFTTWHPAGQSVAHRMTAGTALARTWTTILKEASIVVDALLPAPGSPAGDTRAALHSETPWADRAPVR